MKIRNIFKNDKINKCTFCHRLGHSEPECRIKIAEKKKSASNSYQPLKEEKNQTNIKKFWKIRNSNNSNKLVKPPDGYICRICNKPGHWIKKCPDFKNKNSTNTSENNNNKTVRAATKSELNIQSNKSMNNKVNEISTKCVEIPCTVNGQKVLGLLDTGAELSFIDIHIAKKYNWKIQSTIWIFEFSFIK